MIPGTSSRKTSSLYHKYNLRLMQSSPMENQAEVPEPAVEGVALATHIWFRMNLNAFINDSMEFRKQLMMVRSKLRMAACSREASPEFIWCQNLISCWNFQAVPLSPPIYLRLYQNQSPILGQLSTHDCHYFWRSLSCTLEELVINQTIKPLTLC